MNVGILPGGAPWPDEHRGAETVGLVEGRDSATMMHR
jgi:hypothetical protein